MAKKVSGKGKRTGRCSVFPNGSLWAQLAQRVPRRMSLRPLWHYAGRFQPSRSGVPPPVLVSKLSSHSGEFSVVMRWHRSVAWILSGSRAVQRSPGHAAPLRWLQRCLLESNGISG